MLYDLLIIGAGPAGLTASIYASCFHLRHLVVAKELGGQMLLATHILNYPGFTGAKGSDLTTIMINQAKGLGGEFVQDEAVAAQKIDTGFEVETKQGAKYQAKALILATGTERRKLGVPGENEFTGKGVYYCATCEQQDYEGKVAAVIGGGNSASQSAVQLAQAAAKVYIVYRGSELRGDPIWLEQIKEQKKIEVLYNTQVTEIIGDGTTVTGLKLVTPTGSLPTTIQNPLPVHAVFIEIGGVPGTALVIPLGVEMDLGGYIKVDNKLATSVNGVYAAGDLVSYGLSIEQISTAVGLGARAAASAFAYLKDQKAPSLWGSSQIKR